MKKNTGSGGAVSHDSNSDIKPKTKQDVQLRIKHTKDSIAYNERHMKDHGEALSKAKTQLAQAKKSVKKAPKI